MDDDPPDQENTRFDATSSEEWVDKIAEAEGLSREDVLERLISSYWTLKEMFQLMEQTEENLEPGENPSEVRSSTPTGISSAEFDSFKEEISAELESLREDFEGLETEVHEPVEVTRHLKAQLDSMSDRVSDVESSLTTRQDKITTRLDEEFGNLEHILDYLIETTDEIDDRTQILTNDHFGIRERWAERDRLAELKQLANRAGVSEAQCRYCDTAVNLAMLERPRCPQCDRDIVDIEPNTGWFGFGTSRLEVSSEKLDGSTRPPSDSTDNTDFDWSE